MISGRLLSLRDRFERFVQPCPNTGCHFWTGNRSNWGYGSFRVGSNIDGTRAMAAAHRVAYQIYVGEIPSNVCVLHSCDNGHLGCVNPDHLRLGSHAENSLEMASKGRGRKPVSGLPAGVTRRNSRFRANVSVGKGTYIGSYSTVEEAAAAVAEAKATLLSSRSRGEIMGTIEGWKKRREESNRRAKRYFEAIRLLREAIKWGGEDAAEIEKFLSEEPEPKP